MAVGRCECPAVLVLYSRCSLLAIRLYTGKAFALSVQELIGAEIEIAKRNELHRFAVLPKRWVVERSFSWLEKNRRLWKNCERKLSTSLQMVALAFLGVLQRFQRVLPLVEAGEVPSREQLRSLRLCTTRAKMHRGIRRMGQGANQRYRCPVWHCAICFHCL